MSNFTLVRGIQNQYSALATSGSSIEFDPVDFRYSPSLESFSLTWDTTSPSPTKLFLSDNSGNLVERPRVNRDLYLASVIDNRTRFLNYQKGEFSFADEVSLRTLYLNVPTGQGLKFNDTRALLFLKVGRRRLFNSSSFKAQLLFLCPLSSENNLLINDESVIVGRRCEPYCLGRRCTDADGCGGVCGCPPGSRCNPSTGNCVPEHPTACDPRLPCGGICEGVCPSGQACERDVNGFYRCVDKPNRNFTLMIGLIILIVVLLIALAIQFLR